MKRNRFMSRCMLVLLAAASLFASCENPFYQDLVRRDGNNAPTPPAAPGLPVVEAGNRQLAVFWKAVPEAAEYEVWIALSENTADAERYDSTTETSFVIKPLVNDTNYWVWIRARNSGGLSGFSPVAGGKPFASALNLEAKPGDSKIGLSWTAFPGAASYEIQYVLLDDYTIANEWTKVPALTGTVYTITTLVNGKEYFVKLAAKNNAGTALAEDSLIAMPTTPPPAPAAPTIIARDRSLSVSWAAVIRATAYEVWYGTASDGAGRVQLDGDITGLTAEISGLENNTLYYIWIRAKNPAGISDYSPFAEGTPVLPPEAPGAPTVSESNTQLGLSWAEVPTATAYEIWYGTESNGSDRQKFGGDVTGPPAAITGLENGTLYYAWLKAKNGAGTSGFGPPASGTPQQTGSGKPFDCTVGGVTTGYDTLPEAIAAAMGKTAIITLHADATVTSTFQLNSASGITTDITIEGAGTMRTISCGGSNQILFAWDRSAWGNNYLTLGSGVTLQGKPGATQALLNGYAGAMYGTGKFTMLEGSRITGANTALTIANFDFVMKGGSIDGNRIGVQCSGSGAILENGSIKNNTFYDLSLLGTASAALKGNVEIGNLRVLNQDQLKIGGAWTGCVSALHLLGATDHVTVYEVAEKWINKRVFAAEAGHTLSAADIAKVTPGSFIWTAYNGGNAPVNGTWRYDVWSAYYGYYGFHIGSGQGDGAIGVLIPNSPEPAVTPQNTQLSVRWLGGRSGGKTIWFGKNFEVWYGTAADGSNRQQWNGAITTPSVSSGVYRETVITGLANSTTYYVWIRAKDSGGSSPYGFSRPVYGTPGGIVPAAPAAPTLTAGAGELQVSWAAVSGATAYEVWYGAVIADEYQQFGGDVTGTGAVITGLAKLGSPMGYYVRIRAKNAAGISAFGDKTSMTNVN